AGHGDAALGVDQLAQDGGALHDPDAPLVRGVDLIVVPAHGGSDDDQLDSCQMGRVVADGDRDAAPSEEVGDRGGLEVAAGDGDAGIGKDPGNGAHADPSDADEMNVFNVTKIHSVDGALN